MKRKITSILVAILFMVAGFPVKAETVSLPYSYDRSYINGVSNVQVWLNYASGVSIWQNYITQGVNGWMYTGWNNPIYMNYVSSNIGSNMDFHANTSSYWTGTSASTDTLASTKWFAGDGSTVTNTYGIPIASWWYAEIHINNDNFLQDWFSNDEAQGTIYHEMGHALGLSDNTDFYSIMARYPYRLVQTIQYCDNQGIVYLYGL